MNTTTHFDPWHNRHTINMEPEQMDKFSDEYSLFAGQPNEKTEMEVSLPNLYNLHRRALASLKAYMSKQNN